MSTSVTHPGAATGSPGRNFGFAAAGLAVVIAIGVGFAVIQNDGATVSDAQPVHPMVSDAHRAKAEFLAERQERLAAQQAAQAQEYQENIDLLRYRSNDAAKALAYQEHIDVLRYRSNDAWSPEYQEHIDFLRYRERGAWSQPYQDYMDFFTERARMAERGRIGGQ